MGVLFCLHGVDGVEIRGDLSGMRGPGVYKYGGRRVVVGWV